MENQGTRSRRRATVPALPANGAATSTASIAKRDSKSYKDITGYDSNDPNDRLKILDAMRGDFLDEEDAEVSPIKPSSIPKASSGLLRPVVSANGDRSTDAPKSRSTRSSVAAAVPAQRLPLTEQKSRPERVSAVTSVSRSQKRKVTLEAVEEVVQIRLPKTKISQTLPCRESEFEMIYDFVVQNITANSSGSMYICGVPGTGKTAVVNEVVRTLQQDKKLKFQFIEMNGMNLMEPHQLFVEIRKKLKTKGKRSANANAAADLAKYFNSLETKGGLPTVLFVDELDQLWTRRQDVLYQLFEWPTFANSNLTVLAVANTMDLPERMTQRVTSRAGMRRCNFQPYTFPQIQQVIRFRISDWPLSFSNEAIEFVSRKVAAVSGDLRRALDVCRRAAELAKPKSATKSGGHATASAKTAIATRKVMPEAKKPKLSVDVSMPEINAAMKEMFSSAKMQALQHVSRCEEMILRGAVAEFHRTGLEAATLNDVFRQTQELLRLNDLSELLNYEEFVRACSRLYACRLVICEVNRNDLWRKIRLNVAPEDVMQVLNRE